MGSATFLEPQAAVHAFCAALHTGAEDTAAAACTESGWGLGGTAAHKAWAQARHEGFRFEAHGPFWRDATRAVAHGRISHPAHPGRQRPVWFLVEAKGRGWGVSGITTDLTHAALFWAGRAPGVVDVLALPSVPDAEAWGRQQLAAFQGEVLVTASELAEATGAPVLGLIPTWSEAGIAAFDALPDEHEAVLAYGDLLARLQDRWSAGPLVVGSATPGEGAPIVAAALARLAADQGGSTLLVDLDPNAPSLHAVFGRLNPSPGFTEMASGRTPPLLAVRDGGSPQLVLLTAGAPAAPDPEALRRFRTWIEESAPDQTILLAPAGLAPRVAAAFGAPLLLVAHAGAITRPPLRRLVEQAEQAGVSLLGTAAVRLLPESVPNAQGDAEPAESLREFAEGALASVNLLRIGGLPEVGRALVGFQVAWPDREAPEERWFALDLNHAPPTVVDHGTFPSLELLFTQLDATLPEPTEPAMSKDDQSPPPETPIDAAQVQQVVDTVLSGLRQAAAQGADPAKAKAAGDAAAQLPQLLAGLLGAALRQSDQSEQADLFEAKVAEEKATYADSDNVVDLDAAREQAAGASSVADAFGDDIKRSVGTFFAEHVKDEKGRTPDELMVDPAFVQEHGGDLARGLIGAFAKALFANPVEFDLPSTDKTSGEDKDVKVKLDLGAFFKALIPPEAKPPEGDEPK